MIMAIPELLYVNIINQKHFVSAQLQVRDLLDWPEAEGRGLIQQADFIN